MVTDYQDRHSNFVVLVVCYEHKAVDANKQKSKNVIRDHQVDASTKTNSTGRKVKVIRKWNEFRLPLNENEVLEWSQLPNNSDLKYYHVPTFKYCIDNGINFVNYENHVINDGQAFRKEDLIKKDCYFVFTSDTYSIDFDPKKEEMKAQLLAKFNSLFETTNETSSFYLEASDYDLNLAVKNYYASQRGVKSLEDLFLSHSKNGKADLLSLMLNLEFDKNCKNNIGMNALHLAVRYEHLDCVKLLLQSKYKNLMNDKDGVGNYPIHIASLGSSAPIFELLLKETRDITAKNGEKETVFHMLCKGQANIEIFDLLFGKICEHYDEDFTKYSKYFNLINDDGECAIHIAVRKNHFNLIQHIVNSQLFSTLINFKLKNKLEQSALTIASKEGAFETLQILLPIFSQTIMEKDGRNFTPLHYATILTNDRITNLLLGHLDIQQYNTVLLHNGVTPLQYAIFQNNIELVRSHLNYLENNNSLVVNNSSNKNSLNHALCLCIKHHRSIEVIKEILKYQVDINYNLEGYQEYTIKGKIGFKFPLVDCVMHDSKTAFKFLLRQPNIDINQQSKETGMTSLHYAIIKHYYKPTEHSKYFIMKLIKKTNLNIQDYFLRTVLHLSKLFEFKDVSEAIEALNDSRYTRDLNDIPCKDYTKECNFANNLMLEKYTQFLSGLQAHATNYKLFHGIYLQHEVLNFLYNNTKLSVSDLQSIYKRVSHYQKYLPSVHFVRHINQPVFPQLLHFKYENSNLHLIYTSNTLFEQTSSCRFYLDKNILTNPVHQFSAMFKIISSIYVLHQSNITHGNIKSNSFRFVNDSKLLYLYDYGLFFNQLEEKQSSPEIKAYKTMSNGSINDILSKKSNDIYNLGHLLHEILFGSKYGEKDYSVTSVVRQLYSTILSCFTENEEFRPDIKELYDVMKGTIQNLILVFQENNSTAQKLLEMELKLVEVMINRYGYNDHTKPHEMNNTQNIGKCISKINELVKAEQLSVLNVFNQMPDQLDPITIKQLFNTIHYLIQVLNDKFKAAAFDLLRVLLLKKECVEYLLTHHENLTLVDILDRMKNINNTDPFTLTLISSCLTHCLIHPIGLNYFTNHLDKYDLLVSFILQLLNSTANQEKNAFSASMILYNLRFNVQRIGVQLPPILSDPLSVLAQTQLNFPFIEKSETSQRNTRSLLEACASTLNRLSASLANNTVPAANVTVVKDALKYISLSLYSVTKLDSNAVHYLKDLNFQQLEPYIDSKLYTALYYMSCDFTNEEKEYITLSSRIVFSTKD